jgi:heptosyltransferase III
MSFLREQRRAFGRKLLRGSQQLRKTLFGIPVLPTKERLPKRILIIRPYFLGDILLCLPVAQAIKQQRPQTRISWLLREEWTDLILGHSVVDEVLPFSQKKINSLGGGSEFLRVTREIRARQFDLVINLSWDRSSILWSASSGAPITIGIEEYGRPRFLSVLYTASIASPQRTHDRRHMADFYYEPLKLLGFENRNQLPKVQPNSTEQQKVDSRIAELFPDRNPFILIHPGGRLSQKRWPVESFASLIHKILQQTTDNVLLVCGPGEELWGANLAAAITSKRCRFWPIPTLGEFMALAQKAKLFIGNDSGPMHLAGASGCSVVAIFGNDPVRWSPLGKAQVVYGSKGLGWITVDEVFEAYKAF